MFHGIDESVRPPPAGKVSICFVEKPRRHSCPEQGRGIDRSPDSSGRSGEIYSKTGLSRAQRPAKQAVAISINRKPVLSIAEGSAIRNPKSSCPRPRTPLSGVVIPGHSVPSEESIEELSFLRRGLLPKSFSGAILAVIVMKVNRNDFGRT